MRGASSARSTSGAPRTTWSPTVTWTRATDRARWRRSRAPSSSPRDHERRVRAHELALGHVDAHDAAGHRRGEASGAAAEAASDDASGGGAWATRCRRPSRSPSRLAGAGRGPDERRGRRSRAPSRPRAATGARGRVAAPSSARPRPAVGVGRRPACGSGRRRASGRAPRAARAATGRRPATGRRGATGRRHSEPGDNDAEAAAATSTSSGTAASRSTTACSSRKPVCSSSLLGTPARPGPPRAGPRWSRRPRSSSRRGASTSADAPARSARGHDLREQRVVTARSSRLDPRVRRTPPGRSNAVTTPVDGRNPVSGSSATIRSSIACPSRRTSPCPKPSGSPVARALLLHEVEPVTASVTGCSDRGAR
jgi:hypothetical protein